MRSLIDTIQLRGAQIAALQLMIDSGEYNAAGLHVTLTVGAPDPDNAPDIVLDLGVHTDLDKLLDTMLHGLKASRAWHISNLRKDIAKAKDFLAGLDGDHADD